MPVNFLVDGVQVVKGGARRVTGPQYMVTRAVMMKAKKLGVPLPELVEKARLAAPVSDDRANLRYGDLYIFTQDDTIYGVFDGPAEDAPEPERPTRVKRRIAKAPQTSGLVEIDCPVCADDHFPYCQECGGKGRIRRTHFEIERLANDLNLDPESLLD